MTATVHNVNPTLATNVSALDERLRRETMAAEDVLHDMGAIPIINSDSPGMGRIGEVISRTWQLAHKMKSERGAPEAEHDNSRIMQYLAKYTINPAITHGVSDYVGDSGPELLAGDFHEGIRKFANPYPHHTFHWGLGEIVNAVLSAGYRVDALREYPFANGLRHFENGQACEQRQMLPPSHLPRLPMMFGLQAIL